jgi:anaerobic selenocysteine-containing dehydrogenase
MAFVGAADHHGFDEPPRRNLVPSRAYQLESFELPISPPEGQFGPGPRSRPETQAFLREWPCAALPDEINAGNIRALLNLGGSLLTAFPNAGSLLPALRKLDVLATTEILPNKTTAISTHVLPTKGQLERPDVTLWDILSPRVSAQHTDAVVAPVGQRRSMWWVLAEIGRRLGHKLADTNATDDEMLAQMSSGGRASYGELVANGWAEADRELPAAWVDRHIERLGLAPCSSHARRSAACAAGACPAGAGSAAAATPAQRAAGVSR